MKVRFFQKLLFITAFKKFMVVIAAVGDTYSPSLTTKWLQLILRLFQYAITINSYLFVLILTLRPSSPENIASVLMPDWLLQSKLAHAFIMPVYVVYLEVAIAGVGTTAAFAIALAVMSQEVLRHLR